MITFAALLPHTPLLVPTVGEQPKKKFPKTVAAYETLSIQLKKQAIQTLVIISPHGSVLPDALSLHLHDQFEGTLTEFGDLVTKISFQPDVALIDETQRLLRKVGQPLTINTLPALDYGIMVPLSLLQLPASVRLVPITTALLDAKAHFNFGETLQEIFSSSSRSIAVCASGDLSHRLSSDTPLGFSPEGTKFDAAIQEAIETQSATRLLRLEPSLLEEVQACGFKPIVTLLGILSRLTTKPHLLAYEHPFGVGYLTVHFELTG
ncbi:AmmeMemoRadiSam system protein B [Candidatus Uhrbacteria bacterium]|nr:AmmeMemoRadiSam system protein B [Candidatus Uhrbacteria bacterium]